MKTTTITLFAALASALLSACVSIDAGNAPQAAPSREPQQQQEPSVPAAPPAPTAPAPSAGTGGGLSLEEGIARIGRDIAAALPLGSRAAAVSCASPSARLSGYALDELQGALQDSGRLVVVERAQLDAVRRELNFQYSEDVDEASAVSLGKLLGAQTVIVGSLTPLGGKNARVRFTAIDVETAVRKASPAVTVLVSEEIVRS